METNQKGKKKWIDDSVRLFFFSISAAAGGKRFAEGSSAEGKRATRRLYNMYGTDVYGTKERDPVLERIEMQLQPTADRPWPIVFVFSFYFYFFTRNVTYYGMSLYILDTCIQTSNPLGHSDLLYLSTGVEYFRFKSLAAGKEKKLVAVGDVCILT